MISQISNKLALDSVSWSSPLRRAAGLADYRSNAIRMSAIGGFYGIHLLNYSANSESGPIAGIGILASFLQLDSTMQVTSRTHLALSLIALMWSGWALVIHRSLFEQRLPKWLPYATALVDVSLLTGILLLSAGAQNPLVCGYLLIIMLVAMRLDLRLVRWSTLCAFLGLLTILAATKWPKGLLLEQPLQLIPRHYQLMLGLAILLAGLIAGQWVRSTSLLMDSEHESVLQEKANG